MRLWLTDFDPVWKAAHKHADTAEGRPHGDVQNDAVLCHQAVKSGWTCSAMKCDFVFGISKQEGSLSSWII